MHTLFLVCLVIGVILVVAFTLSGHGMGHHAHVHHHGGSHSGGHGGSHDWRGSALGFVLSWLSPLTLAAAILWFGGAGVVSDSLLVAIPAALVGGALIRLVMNAFVRSSTPPLALSAEGAIGTINATIRAGGTGEVVYTLEDLHRSLPARSTDGVFIPRGTPVVITRCSGGIAWVEPLDPLSSP